MLSPQPMTSILAPARIFLIEDDPGYAHILSRSLRMRQIEVEYEADPEKAMKKVAAMRPDCVVLDLNLGGASGLSLIRPLLALNPEMRILVLTGYANLDTAVAAIKLGAIQYLAKPVSIDDVLRGLGLEAANGGGGESAPGRARPLPLEDVEWKHIRKNLQAHGGNVSATARALKMNLRTLQRKIAKYRNTSKDLRQALPGWKRRRRVRSTDGGRAS